MGEVQTVDDQQKAVALAPTEQSRDGFVAAIVKMASNPAVNTEKLEAIMKMQFQLEAREAEKTFAAAFARLSAKLPRVKKNGTISLIDKNGVNKGSIAFAKWEDMDAVIRPLMVGEGFTLSFDSAPRSAEGGGLVVTGTLMHVDGAKRTASIPLALDTGPGRNNLQAMGSSLSYGKRYCAEMLLNIVREGQDDDGKKGGAHFITTEQQKELQDDIDDLELDERQLRAYLDMCGVQHLGEIQQGGYVTAKNMLNAKKQQKSKKGSAA